MTSSAITSSTTPTYQTYPSVSSPVSVSSTGANLSQTAVSLSTDASVIATLGGSSSGSTVYDAAGLLNTLTQAGVVTNPITVPTPGKGSGVSSQVIGQDANDASVVNTLSSSAAASGVYTSGGTLQNLPSATATNVNSLLSANPGLSSAFVGDSYNSGIISTISTSA